MSGGVLGDVGLPVRGARRGSTPGGHGASQQLLQPVLIDTELVGELNMEREEGPDHLPHPPDSTLHAARAPRMIQGHGAQCEWIMPL